MVKEATASSPEMLLVKLLLVRFFLPKGSLPPFSSYEAGQVSSLINRKTPMLLLPRFLLDCRDRPGKFTVIYNKQRSRNL
jgi:hypothetical protein